MKKLFLLFFAAGILSTGFISCREQNTEADDVEDVMDDVDDVADDIEDEIDDAID